MKNIRDYTAMLRETHKRETHYRLIERDADYRFECACCGEEATFNKYSWDEMRERLAGPRERFLT